MKTKRLKVPIETTREYIDLFNGIFHLTEMEKNVLSEFIDIHLDLQKNGGGSAFTSEMRKVVASKISKDDPHVLAGYIKKLKEKGALTPSPAGIYDINPVLLPLGESEITFKIR